MTALACYGDDVLSRLSVWNKGPFPKNEMDISKELFIINTTAETEDSEFVTKSDHDMQFIKAHFHRRKGDIVSRV